MALCMGLWVCVCVHNFPKSFISRSFISVHVGEWDVSLNNICEFVRIIQGTEVRRATYCDAILLIRWSCWVGDYGASYGFDGRVSSSWWWESWSSSAADLVSRLCGSQSMCKKYYLQLPDPQHEAIQTHEIWHCCPSCDSWNTHPHGC